MSSPEALCYLPPEERPRERLLNLGVGALSSVELLALLLGSGTRGKSVLQLAQQLLSHFGTLEAISLATVEELCEVRGIGLAKAIQLVAAFHLSGRLNGRKQDACDCLLQVRESLECEKRELFIVLFQNVRGKVVGQELISIGSLSETIVHPREVFYPAIRHKAARLVLVHNHPSGDPSPSAEDISMTVALVNVGRMVGIPVVDHLIVGKGCFVSLREKRKELFS